jgi:hypothetical protein
MRVGSLVYDTTQGLGLLAKSFYDNGIVTDVMVVEHGRRPSNRDWYPNAPRLGVIKETAELRDFVDSMDVMLFFETPFVWSLFDHARKCDTKTVLMPMHECLDERRIKEHKPDLFLCPSLLEFNLCDKLSGGLGNAIFLPVPVDVPWRQRTRAEVFVHNAGWGGLKGRNGTSRLLEALPYIKSPVKFIVRTQENMCRMSWLLAFNDYKGKIELVQGTETYKDMWERGDVFVFPETFNGLSLPLQEARAAGMLVMCGDRFPMNSWLPTGPLIPVKEYKRDQRTFPQFCAFDEAVYDPREIADTIDRWYGVDITEYSLQGKAWAESMSWATLGSKYISLLGELVQS